MDGYFARFEEIQEHPMILTRECFEANEFSRLRDEGIVTVTELPDGDLNVVSRIRIRTEPLFGDYIPRIGIASLSDLRTRRPEKIGLLPPVETDVKSCVFCPHLVYKLTPKPRIKHNLERRSGEPVLSFPNLYPFTAKHYVTVFADHKPDLHDLTLEDMTNYFQSAYDMAKKYQAEGAISMWSVMNWGLNAGASQPHPHAQHGIDFNTRGTIRYVEGTAVNYVHEKTGKDPFQEYMARMRDSEFFIFENDCVFITAPFAPLFPDQVDVIVKGNARNILETTQSRDIMARSMLGAFHMLREKRGVTDLNVVWHQDVFEHNGTLYRLHAHLIPRNKNKYAAAEIYGNHVNPVDPEKTAAEGRAWYARR